MTSNGETINDVNGDSFDKLNQKIKDRSKKVAQTKEIFSKQAVQTKEILSKQAVKIAKQAEEHERFINKVTHLLGVLGFGAFCFILGARPQDIRYDFCYYANTIFLIMLLFYPRNEKLFMVSLICRGAAGMGIDCLAIEFLRWWDQAFFEAMHPEGTAQRASWPYIEGKSYLWTWLFLVPLVAYSLWQALYFLIVNVLRRQRLLRDPEVMTSYRELSKKAQKANNLWWRLSGLLGDQNRMFMYILLQALFTVATMALTVPIFLSYELHVLFQILKVSASVWNGGSFLLEVMPRQVVLKEKKKSELQPVQVPQQQDHSSVEPDNFAKTIDSPEAVQS
ncbi:hypothetical protein LguiB_011889 [Lonicera macranthoides]